MNEGYAWLRNIKLKLRLNWITNILPKRLYTTECSRGKLSNFEPVYKWTKPPLFLIVVSLLCLGSKNTWKNKITK